MTIDSKEWAEWHGESDFQGMTMEELTREDPEEEDEERDDEEIIQETMGCGPDDAIWSLDSHTIAYRVAVYCCPGAEVDASTITKKQLDDIVSHFLHNIENNTAFWETIEEQIDYEIEQVMEKGVSHDNG